MRYTTTGETIVERADYCTCGQTGGCPLCQPIAYQVARIVTTNIIPLITWVEWWRV